MTTISKEKISDIQIDNNLAKDYPWFYSNLYKELEASTKEFFQKNFEIRFLGVSQDENILFYGDEYFVNKIPVNKTADFKMKISSEVIELLLDTALGSSENKFELNSLTDIEAMLIKSYSVYVYKKIEDKFEKAEVSKKVLQKSKNLNFTFFIRTGKEHTGKIIINIPDYVLPEIKNEEKKETFGINDFKKTSVNLNLCLGKSKIALNDIKAIEDGDIIVLEESDINKMSVILDNREINFKINPNPSLIISIDNNGGNEMEEETSIKPQNMWDSILVDIVAEFDNVKLTLGELKQISEGLVIDVGSVYDNKVKLRVENQVVATGELVILNDRYGVRIESVKKAKEPTKTAPAAAEASPASNPNPAAKQPAPSPAARPSASAARRPARPTASSAAKTVKPAAQNNADENFDYSDFEIEDESI